MTALRFRSIRGSSEEEGYGDVLFGRDARGLEDNFVRRERCVDDARALLEGLGLGLGLLGTTTFSTRMVGGAVLSFDFWPKSPMTTLFQVVAKRDGSSYSMYIGFGIQETEEAIALYIT